MAKSKEVETVAKSKADVLLEQGETRAKQEIVLKLMQIRFNNVPADVSKKITSVRSISRLDSIIEKIATAETLDEIDLQNHSD